MSLKVTVTEQVSNVTVTEQVIEVTDAVAGPQGPQGNTGPQGPSGVINVTAPITNSGTSTSANIGINAGVANGVATLDGSGKIPTTQLPPLAVNDTFVVASQAAMLALTAEVGDVAVRTDQSKTYILTASPASTLANWQLILTPPAVTSINTSGPITGGPITSTGTIGIDQTAITIGPSQVTGTAVVTNDSRLSDARTPTAHASTHGVAGSDPITIDTSQVNWSAIAAWQPNTPYAKGALVEYQGIAYRRSVAGTSGPTFNSANWQQFTPTPTSSGAADSLVKTDSLGGITAADQISATRFVSGGTSQDANGFTALTYNYAATGPGKATLVKGGTSSTNESLVLPSTSGTLIGTGDSKTVTTSMIADSAITSTQIADNTITSGDIQQLPGMYLPTSGIDTVPRLFLGQAQNPYSGGNIRFTTFQANQSFTASKIIVHVANTPVYATGTHQFFLCSYDQTTGYTPKGSSQLFTSASPLPNTGGALNSVNLTALSGGNLSIVAGNWYAIGMWGSSGFTLAPTHVAAAGSLASSIFAGAGSNSITLYPAYAASATSATAPTTTATITATASYPYPIWFRILP